MSQAVETVIVGPAAGVGGSRPLGFVGLGHLRPGLWAAGLFVVLLVIASTVPQMLAPYDPLDATARLAFQQPNAIHWLGTDENGRDVLSRLIYGVRSCWPFPTYCWRW